MGFALLSLKLKEQYAKRYNKPTLFKIFINDINELFKNDACKPLKLLDSEVSCLRFADDIIILSENREGLQNCLNSFSNYCDQWQLIVNTK